MLVTAEKLEIARPTQSLAPRYESLIRLAEAIRSHRNQKDLFQLLADELRQVVPFDVMAQCDHAGKKVNWHFSGAYDSEISRVPDIPKEETVGWWVDQTQQPLVLQVTSEETRFRTTIEALNKLGLRSLCALPLSTAHRQLGSLVFISQFEPIEDNVEIAPFERGNELVPLILDHLRFDPQLRRYRIGQFVFESNQLFRLFRIGINIWRASFGVSAPEQDSSSFDFLQSICSVNLARAASQEEQKKEVTKSCARRTPCVTHRCGILPALEILLNSFSRF